MYRMHEDSSKYSWIIATAMTKMLIQILGTDWALPPSLLFHNFLLPLAVRVRRQLAEFQMPFSNWNTAF